MSFSHRNSRAENEGHNSRILALNAGALSSLPPAAVPARLVAMPWLQNYDPLDHALLSTLVAAIPIVILLGLIAFFKIQIHWAALLGLGSALLVALFAYGMPWAAAVGSAAYGAATGLFPIGWIVLNLLFLYELTVRRGLFAKLRDSLSHIAPDPRVQVVLIAFSFGAFFEGAAGFGTPVAVTGAILLRLGFRPLQACGLALIANTAPVAFGALGTPIIALEQVTGIPAMELSKMAGRQLPFFSVIVPFWCVWALAGFRGMLGVWPAALVGGVGFAIPQYLVSNFHGPALVDIVASLTSILSLLVLLKFWRPRDGFVCKDVTPPAETADPDSATRKGSSPFPWLAWTPWILLSVIVFVWGLPEVKKALDGIAKPEIPFAGIHNAVQRTPPVVEPGNVKAEAAVYKWTIFSAAGTGILIAALLTGLILRFRPAELGKCWLHSLWKARHSLLTIAAMLALGNVTKYCGADATMGLALAKTGAWYPFCGTLLGWLGVALTGSDTASNTLFGGLQKITSQQLGIDPVLMCAANSTGGVMGKMIDAQSIVVASTATQCYGMEGKILRFVFFHSIALASLIGLLVTLQAKVPPFTHMVP